MGLSDVLALELRGSGVGVTSVCPGIINTAITAGRANFAPSVSDEQVERLQGYYRQNGADPEVVASAIVRAVQRGCTLVLVGPKAKPSYHMKRISRALTARLAFAASKEVGFV
jgi:short-subunit dehydrogenase